MNPTKSTFNVNALSRRQKRQLEQTGSFRTSRGQYKDAQGNIVNVNNNTKVNNPGTTPALSPTATTAVSNPIASPVQATDIQPNTNPQLPEPQAPAIQESYQTGVAGDVVKYRTAIDTTLNNEKTRLDAEINDLKKEQQSILDKQGDLTEPFRAKLEEKERERLYINKNFEENQKLVDELDKLLTEGNELIRISKGRAVANTVLEKSVNKTIADVQARAGVIQAVMSARSGQIAEAERLIDRSVAAITADRQDQLAYYDTLLNLNNQNLLRLDDESKAIAQEQRNLAYNDLERAQKTADFIKSLMINPDTAKFMADSGVSLQDDLDTIKTKMSKEATRVELINEAKAYAEMAIGSGYASQEELALLNDVTIDTQSKKALAEKVIARSAKSEADMKIAAHNASMESARLGNRAKTIELALAGDPNALAALNFDPRTVNAEADLQAHTMQAMENQSMLDAITRMKSNDAGIKSSTGTVRNAFLQGMFAGPVAGQGSEKRGALSTLFSLTPVIGNISNTVYAMNQKKNLLSDATYLVNNATFKKIISLKQQGVTPGQLTEAERRAFGAADVLGSLLEVQPDGSVTAIRGTEANFRRAVEEFETAVVTNQDFANSKFLTAEEKAYLNQ